MTYNGVDFNFRKRLSNRWMIMGGVSIGKNEGDIYGGNSDLNNPNFAFRAGCWRPMCRASSRRRVSTNCRMPISLSGSVQYYTRASRTDHGFGRQGLGHSDSGDAGGHRRSAGNDPASIGDHDRFEPEAIVHGSIAGSIEPALDIFNIGNINTVTSRSDATRSGLRPCVRHHPWPDGEVRSQRRF